MSEEKPSISISDQAPAINFSCRDGKKLTSLLWNQDELVNKKRRWLIERPATSMPDGGKKKIKRPKFLTDVSLTESCLRSDEVSYENVRRNVEKSFGAFGGSQSRHHVVQDYLQFFETFNTESCSVDQSHFLGKFYSMMKVLSNNALSLIASLVTVKKFRFKKTRPTMIKIIKDHLPRFLQESSHQTCSTLMEQLSEIFRDPGNFRKKQLTLLTTISPLLLSSIHKALKELDELPFQDLVAMNRKLRDIIAVPQFPPPRFSGTRDLLLERVKKRCQKVLSTLREGAELPKPFAKALSIIQLSLKEKTRCVEIMASEFYPFSPQTVGLQNEILGALWSLPKVRIHELKALQFLVDPEAKFPRKTFRIALRKYLMDYLFNCDVVDIPEGVTRLLASLNRRSRRRLQLFSVGMMNEDVEATLSISSQLKQVVSNLFPEDTIDENSEALDDDDDAESNDFALADDSYCPSPTSRGHDFSLNDRVEGTGDSGTAMATEKQGHTSHCNDSCIINDFVKKQPTLEQEDDYINGDSTMRSNLDPGDDTGSETLIQEICDETSLVAYKLIGHMLDSFLLAEGRDTNDMTRCYLRGGSSLESAGAKDSIHSSKEDVETKILVESVQELLPSLPKSCIERVKKLMGS